MPALPPAEPTVTVALVGVTGHGGVEPVKGAGLLVPGAPTLPLQPAEQTKLRAFAEGLSAIKLAARTRGRTRSERRMDLRKTFPRRR